jgi:hypothetical protein
MPEGEDTYTARQAALLKWRVFDALEERTSKTDPFRNATLEIVQAIPQSRYPNMRPPPSGFFVASDTNGTSKRGSEREDSVNVIVAQFRLTHSDISPGACHKSEYAEDYECWMARVSTTVAEESMKPVPFAERYWKIPEQYFGLPSNKCT